MAFARGNFLGRWVLGLPKGWVLALPAKNHSWHRTTSKYPSTPEQPQFGGRSVNGYFPSFKELVLRKGKKPQTNQPFLGQEQNLLLASIKAGLKFRYNILPNRMA